MSGLAVVVPNFNGAHVLPRCLDALRAQTLPPDEVVVVDNGSTDGSADNLGPSVRVIKIGRNTGFGAAANRGAGETTAPLIAVLNSDARPVPCWGAAMAAFAHDAPPQAWSWGGVLTSPGVTIESAGDCYSPAGFAYKHAQGRRLDELPQAPWEVFAPPGAAPVFRRSVFEELGGYDPRYFLYLEDIDLAFRARSRGFTSWVLPGSEVEHDLGASGTGVVATRFIARNTLWCQVTHAPALNPRLLLHTTRRELEDAHGRGVTAAYLRGRIGAMTALPRLLALRRSERRARSVADAALLRACNLPGALA